MGGVLGGGKNTTIDNGSVANFQINQATYGITVPIILGTSRQSANVIDWFNFTKTSHKSTQKTGKGGGSKTTTITYTYKAAVLLALCEGQIAGIDKVWVDTDTITTLADTGLTLFNGAIGQPVWDYTITKEPTHALPYSGLAYVAGYIDLNDSGGLKTYGFEIQGQLRTSPEGLDINPADGVVYVLTDSSNGLGFNADNLHAASLLGFKLFCKASNLFITVPLTDQEESYGIINKLCDIPNTIVFWSQRKIKFVPRCEEAITGNGVTYTPNTTPEYDLGPDDFKENDEGKLVTWERTDNAETYNHVTVEFTNRANGYETETAEWEILADINERGRRSMPTVSYPWIHDKATAERVAQQKAMDSCYSRNTYMFTIGASYALLEPGDIVTLTDVAISLNKLPVMIEEYTENGDEYYDAVAKYRPFGTYSPARYSTYDSDRAVLDRYATPGNVKTPLFFETPFLDGSHNMGIMACGVNSNIWGGAYVWISFDDESYQQIGDITGPDRYGKITTAITTASTSVIINLADHNTQILSASTTAADANATLIAIGTEWMAYETATLVSAGVYALSGLRRGLYGSTISSHAIDDDFLRYDSEAFLYPYTTDDIGRTVYIKLTSYNVFGVALQDLNDVDAYEYTIRGAGSMSRIERATKEITVAGWTNFTFTQAFNKVPSLNLFAQTVGSTVYQRNITATGFEALIQASGVDSIGEFIYEAQGW